MKTLNQYIEEKLVLNSNSKIRKQQEYKFRPESNRELRELVIRLIKERGDDADLNDIDTCEITDMSNLFQFSKFNGDISGWDVSNVENMDGMFYDSKFTGKNGDISKWDVSKVTNMFNMFNFSKFNSDISKWDVSNVEDMRNVFLNCPIKEEYKPKFKK